MTESPAWHCNTVRCKMFNPNIFYLPVMPAQIYGRHILPESRFTLIKNVNFRNSLLCSQSIVYCSTGDIILRDFYIMTLAIGWYLPLTALLKHQKRKWQDPKSRLSKYKWAQTFLLNLKVSEYYLQIYVLFISYACLLVFGK